ncbi:transposable element Tc3 transposase [Trichonephila clavipes]|nr:transposable element Tc3 transposase [Trichonephila clavipes]
MSSRRESTNCERLLAVNWSKEGKSLREIASLIGVTHGCVQKLLQKYKKKLDLWPILLEKDVKKYWQLQRKGRSFTQERKIRGEAGKALAPKNTIKTVQFGGGSVLVWGCMSAGGVGELAFIDGVMGKHVCLGILKDNLERVPVSGLLATDHVILNHGQVTWTTPELAPPLLTTTSHQREDVSALDRFNVHRCPTRRVFSGTGFEPVTKQATVRYLYHWATAATSCQVIYSQFGLAIHQNDHQARRRFVEWAQNEIAVVPDFHKRILFSDEAHFWLNGYVNKQNCRIWSEVNPQVYVETPLHPEKLTVWCALWAGESFFKNDEGHNVTVNGDRYRAMITNFFIPELNNHDVQELWFQQDGATCHTARDTIDLLKDTLGDRLISRFGPVSWPPRSCDLTPLDYFLRGYVKSLVYADKPQTLDHLEDNIHRVIAEFYTSKKTPFI